MNRQSAPWIGLGFVLLLAACAACFWFSSKTETAERDNQRLVARQLVLKDEISVLKRKLAEADSKGTVVPQAARQPEPTPSRHDDSAAQQQWQRRFSVYRHKAMMRNIWARYHDAIARLNLPLSKQVELVNLMAAKEEAPMDVADITRSQGITNPKEIDAASKRARDEVESEIAAIVGQESRDSLEHSQEIKGQEEFIDRNVGADLQMGGVPLNSDQEAAIAQIYLDVPKALPPTDPTLLGNGSDGRVVRLEQVNAATLDRAASVLTSEQLAILKNYLNWTEDRMKVMADLPK